MLSGQKHVGNMGLDEVDAVWTVPVGRRIQKVLD
jgi:hypothetical protein